jgi:hypothetical protein
LIVKADKHLCVAKKMTKTTGTKYLLLFFQLILFYEGFAQDQRYDITIPPAQGYRCRAEVVNGDTIPVIDLYDVDVCTTFVFRNRRQYEMWTRTKQNVKIVYPYAILAAAKLREYDKALEKIEDETTRKAFLKICEKDLKKEFEDELKELSVTQGRILMKLIDRESGKTTYDIVEQLRGHFQAVMWNALASLFGNNMKVEYDPVQDIMIERAIKLVEAGAI